VSALTLKLARAGITDTSLNLGIYRGRIVCYDYAMLSAEAGLTLLRTDTSKLDRLRSPS
jgi:hypothetical protein